MINLRRNTYLLSILTVILLSIAALCVVSENTMDIFFLGAGIVFSVITFRNYGKLRTGDRSRSY